MKPETLEIITKSAKETQQIGRILAQEIIKTIRSAIRQPAEQTAKKNSRPEQARGRATKKALVIGLEGELGSGKTTFIQGLAKGMEIREAITSPTFVILKKFDLLPQASSIRYFYHIDCYRINRPQELIDLDFKEIINNSQNIIVIEWAERIRKILPPDTWWIKFEHFGQNQRRISLRITNEKVSFN